MSSFLSSLQFRLIAGFALVLAMALGTVSLYLGYAAEQETKRYQQDLEEARAARIERLAAQYYSARAEWPGLQPALEQAGSLYGWRIQVRDPEGRVVGDSHLRSGRPWRDAAGDGSRYLPVLSGGRPVGFVLVTDSDVPPSAPEPSSSRLVSAVNRSLLWAGLATGLGGVLLVVLISRRSLAPVRALDVAARRLGRGDLGVRVATSGRDEVSRLGHTFNAMAQGLEEAEKQRRTLVADVAHELRTPLSNIQGYLEAVKDGVIQPDSATIDTIHEQAVHLGHLVEDLRFLALAEAGALRLHLEPDSLEDVVRRSVDGFRPRSEGKGVALSLETPAHMPLVLMDRARIAQVIGNLVENAIVHTPAGGRVVVQADTAGDRARVTVADTGEGISAQDLPHIFERFYRVDQSRSRATGGVGLGLTIARQLVGAHGGTICAESTLGQGSCFSFELPLAERST
ncbi:MAG: HAMP domain-containing protein [Chloroflexi bacterium]|nr:HAMP domain-containing protein [Chloroflexota bacterium]